MSLKKVLLEFLVALDGLYVLSGAVGLVARHVRLRHKGRFVISGADISEEVATVELSRRVVSELVWRGGRV